MRDSARLDAGPIRHGGVAAWLILVLGIGGWGLVLWVVYVLGQLARCCLFPPW